MPAASDVPSPGLTGFTAPLSSPGAGSAGGSGGSRLSKYKGFLDAIASAPVQLARAGSLAKQQPQQKWNISVAVTSMAQREAERAASRPGADADPDPDPAPAPAPAPGPERAGRSPSRDLLSTATTSEDADEQLYTLYVQNPTHNLTLTRSAAALGALDMSLRQLGHSTPPLPSATDSTHVRTTTMATYLTTLAASSAVVQTNAWKHFFQVEADDLQSTRVERRVRARRSDLAQHVLSSVAPRNTNIVDQHDAMDAAFDASDTPITSAATATVTTPEEAFTPTRIDGAELDTEPKGLLGPVSLIPEEPMTSSSRLSSEDTEMAEADDTSDHGAREMSVDMDSTTNTGDGPPIGPSQDKVTVSDFEVLRVLGKGCAGKVLLVRHKGTKGMYAMKSIHKRHVLAHQELSHTITEQAVLKRMASEECNPFVVKLWWSFHDAASLYLVMDFQAGGDLATQLNRWARLGRDRARFYAAEIVEGVEGLHRIGVIYRDLKPENVLIGADGHIVLSDFGLSKGFWLTPGEADEPGGGTIRARPPHWLLAGGEDDSGLARRSGGGGRGATWRNRRQMATTFCGTAEYLAPEVILGHPYSYEVDWYSFGTMLFEMLVGQTPFWADNHAEMYARVLHDPLVFPEDRVLDKDTKSILRGLLQRDPLLRIQEPRIKKHPYFSMIDWSCVSSKRYIPPWQPPIDPLNELDTQNFEDCFLQLHPSVTNAGEGDYEEEERLAQAERERATGLKKDRMAAYALAHGYPNALDNDSKSIFDGYSYRGRRDSSVFGAESDLDLEDEEDEDEDDEQDGNSGVSTPQPTVTEQAVSAHAKVAAVPSTEAMADMTVEAPKPASSSDRCLPRPLALVSAMPGSSTTSTTEFTATATPARTPIPSSPNPMALDVGIHTPVASKPTAATELSNDALPATVPATTTTATTTTVTASAVPTEPDFKRRAPKKRVKIVSAHEPHEERASDDWDDWALVDGAQVRSEVNGGRGQNLIARGVDIYRLRFRGEPTRSSTVSNAAAPISPTRPSAGRWLVGRGPNSPSRERESASRALTRILGSDHAQAVTDDESARTTAARNARATRSPAPLHGRKTRKASATLVAPEDADRKASKAKRMKRFTSFFMEAARQG